MVDGKSFGARREFEDLRHVAYEAIASTNGESYVPVSKIINKARDAYSRAVDGNTKLKSELLPKLNALELEMDMDLTQ